MFFQDDLTMSRLILVFLATVLIVSSVQGERFVAYYKVPLSPSPSPPPPPALDVYLMWDVECIMTNFSKTDPYPLFNWEIKRFRLFSAGIHLVFKLIKEKAVKH